MKDPKRWLDRGGSSTQIERSILADAADVEPPEGARAAVWAALSATVAVGAGLGVAGTTTVAGATSLAPAGKAVSMMVGKSAVSAFAVKSLVAGLVVAAVGTGGYGYHRSMSHAAPPPAASTGLVEAASDLGKTLATAAVAQAPSPTAEPVRDEAPAAEPPATVAAPARPAPVAVNPAPAPPASSDRSASLTAETRLLLRARDALRRGDAARALRLVEEAASRYPGGGLAQEADAIRIEALARSGNKREASERLTDFEHAHPGSPHAERLRDHVE
jgi:hypothetical protein